MIVGFFGQKNKWTHDHSCAISENGVLKTYVQLERITQKKFDNRIPDYLGPIIKRTINPDEIEDIELGYANTFSLDEKLFFKRSDNNITSKNGVVEFIHQGSSNLAEQTVVGKFLGKRKEATIVPHEIAQVFSIVPFYGLFKNNSLLIHVDGAASICNASAWLFRNNELSLLEKTTDFHHSLLNFSYNDLSFSILKINKSNHLSMPGKLMGFASYGACSKGVMVWLRSRDFFRDFDQFPKEHFIREAKEKFNYKSKTINQNHKLSFDVTACIQKDFEEKILNFIKKHQQNTGAKFLYYTGGAALNIKLNAKIVNLELFDEIAVPPPAGDSGLSLGVISYMAWKRGETIKKQDPFLNNYGLEEPNYNPNFSIDEVCRNIANGSVIGVCSGFGEAGPRALGHRSILANACISSMKKHVSLELKKREWYRPLAPIVLESEIDELFESFIPNPLMKYMLYEFQVKNRQREKISAATHCDGTARAQVISADDPAQKLMIEILETMRDIYDVPCLINTSFNMSGYPIVHTEGDALDTAKKMGLDGVILNNNYIILR